MAAGESGGYQTLTEALAELERADPAVRAAAESYDRMVERLTSPYRGLGVRFREGRCSPPGHCWPPGRPRGVGDPCQCGATAMDQSMRDALDWRCEP